MIRRPPKSTLFPSATLSRSDAAALTAALSAELGRAGPQVRLLIKGSRMNRLERVVDALTADPSATGRSEEHTSELQSRLHLVCRLLLEKKTYQTKSFHYREQ